MQKQLPASDERLGERGGVLNVRTDATPRRTHPAGLSYLTVKRSILLLMCGRNRSQLANVAGGKLSLNLGRRDADRLAQSGMRSKDHGDAARLFGSQYGVR